MRARGHGDCWDLKSWIGTADDATVRGLVEQFGTRHMADLANTHWHAIGYRVRPGGEPPAQEVIPADAWKYLRYDGRTRTARGGGVEYIAVEIHAGPQPKKLGHEDAITVRLREVYRQMEARDGKPPSQRAVHRESGSDREAVNRRWHLITK